MHFHTNFSNTTKEEGDIELSELIESIDILEYISQYTEFEEKNGEYWALSPFKWENTPSFSVRTETGSFYDFSSGIGGNVLTFVRHYNHCGYKKAIEILKKYAGVEGTNLVGPVRPKKFTATEVAKKYTPKKKTVKESKTSALPANYMERYEKNPEKLAIWEAEGISKASIDKFQVFYDSFSDRLVYPIKDVNGNIINVSGRTLDPEWKEKKIRKYTYFKQWGTLDTLYGLSDNMEFVLDKREVIVFEGAKSVMLADSWGIHNTAAILTSHLNPNQMKILAKLGCRVVFALDEDVDVREDHNIKKLKQFVKIEYVVNRDGLLGSKMAPVDAGLEVWQKLYESRVVMR